MTDKKLYTTKEISVMFGESAGTLGRLRHEGKGPTYFKCGKTVRYRLEDVKAWQEQAYRRIKPTAI